MSPDNMHTGWPQARPGVDMGEGGGGGGGGGGL